MAEEIILDLKPKENKIKNIIPILIIIIIAFIFFAGGFALGKYTKFEIIPPKKEDVTASATKKNWNTFKASTYTFEYPKNWQVKKNSKKDPPGAKIEGDGAKVEFWFTNIREYRFSNEQKEKQKEVQETTINIDKQTAYVTIYSFQKGDYFIVVELPKNEDKPKVVFWAIAANNKFKQTALGIITSFETKKKVVKKSK